MPPRAGGRKGQSPRGTDAAGRHSCPLGPLVELLLMLKPTGRHWRRAMLLLLVLVMLMLWPAGWRWRRAELLLLLLVLLRLPLP